MKVKSNIGVYQCRKCQSKLGARKSRYRHEKNVYMIRIMFPYIVVNVPQEKITTKNIPKTVWGSKRKLQKNLSVKPAIKFFQ